MSKKENEVKEIFGELFKYIPDSLEQKVRLDFSLFDSGIFLNDFNDIIEEIKCPICLQISLESEQCSQCRAIYCKKCIKEKKIKHCSSCRKIYKGSKLDRVLENVMGHLLIRCENCKKFGNLEFKVKLSQIKEHLKKCEYSSYQCLICNKKFFNSQHDCILHSFSCGYSDVNCTYCEKKIKAYKKDVHEKKCAVEEIECSQCHKNIERKNMKKHKNEECIYREITCKDCNEKYILKDGHTKEKCLTNQNELLRAIISENIDIISISKEKASFLKIEIPHIPMRRQNTESNFYPFEDKLDHDFSKSERKSESKYNYIFMKSSIIKNEEDMKYILGLFKKNIKKFLLIYKMTTDGEKKFHQKCDDINNTLSLIKIKNSKNFNLDKKRIYGGYAEQKWDVSKQVKTDSNSFIFSFTDKSNPFYSILPYHSIICYPEFGPSFGVSNQQAELWIKNRKGRYDYTSTYGDEKRICTGGATEFDVFEVEVFQIIFE